MFWTIWLNILLLTLMLETAVGQPTAIEDAPRNAAGRVEQHSLAEGRYTSGVG